MSREAMHPAESRRPVNVGSEVSLKILCCHDDTWFHLNLTFLKP